MKTLSELHRSILIYLYGEEKGRQKGDIARAVGSTPGYIKSVLNELKRYGFIELKPIGWWYLTEKGKAFAEGNEDKWVEPFFTEREVNENVLLITLSRHPMEGKKKALEFNDEILQFLVGLYLLKKNKPMPTGRELTPQEAFFVGRITDDLITQLRDVQSRNYSEVK